MKPKWRQLLGLYRTEINLMGEIEWDDVDVGDVEVEDPKDEEVGLGRDRFNGIFLSFRVSISLNLYYYN